MMLSLVRQPVVAAAAAAATRRLSVRSRHRYIAQPFSSTSGGGGDDDDDKNKSVSEEWIPPTRPLAGDSGESHLYDRTGRRAPRRSAADVSADDKGDDDDDVINLKLSDVDLESIDWDSLEVLGGKQDGSGAIGNITGMSLDDIEAFEETPIDVEAIEAYVAKTMAEESNIDMSEQDMLEGEEFDEEQERLELDMLEEEIMKLEREEEEEAARRSKSGGSGESESQEEEGGGFLDDDPTSLSIDDFLFDRAVERIEQRKMEESTKADGASASTADGPDWLAARRSRLGQEESTTSRSPKAVAMLSPADADAARELDSEIPIIQHTLLTSNEINISLSALGAEDITVIHPDFGHNGTTGLDADGLIIATGRSTSHIRVLAESIVRNLRARGLQRRGIVGAMLGPEGGEDRGTSRRNRRRSGGLASSRLDDGWMVVDCGNYFVHLQDETTRKDINLEGLWAGEEGRKLRGVDISDEDAVDEYVAKNPVPDDYARSVLMQGAAVDIVLPNFARKGRGERWNPVKKVAKKKGRRRL